MRSECFELFANFFILALPATYHLRTYFYYHTKMSSICCIVPEYILHAIIEKQEAPEHIIGACRSNIETTKRLHDARIQKGQSITSAQLQQAAEGIVPPYIHENIARHAATAEQRETFLRTLEHDTKFRAAAEAVHHLERTIYDVHHSYDLSRDNVMIEEGGVLVSKTADPSENANECYIGFKKTYDFYFDFFKRDSLNGRGLKLDGFVHYGERYANAFWDGTEMVFGDGDGHIFNGFTDELDVIAHELTHGMVQYASPLDYKFQSGALNESIADVFGIMVKQWGKDPGHPQTVDQSNWLIGEGIWAEGINGKALRDMKNPGTAYDDKKVGKDRQPAHWKDFKKLEISEDRGGVHINSGIPNHAFYLAASKIGGYAWNGAGSIWYKAIASGKLSTNATFKEFADLTIKNAGEHMQKVREAWMLVGYPFPESREEL